MPEGKKSKGKVNLLLPAVGDFELVTE